MANLVFLNVTNLTGENLLKYGILGLFFPLQIKSRVSIGDGGVVMIMRSRKSGRGGGLNNSCHLSWGSGFFLV